MSLSYDVFCYRVMYRNDFFDKWCVEDFSTETAAYIEYRKVRELYKYARMLKIEKLT